MGPKYIFRWGVLACAISAFGCSGEGATAPAPSACDGYSYAELSRSDFHHACQIDAKDEAGETVRCAFDSADQPVPLGASDAVHECYCNAYYFCRGARP